MRVCLFEDVVDTLEPLALTRPVFELRCGLVTLGDKQRRVAKASSWGMWIRPSLAELAQAQHPTRPINDVTWLRGGTTVWINGRWLPEANAVLHDLPAVGVCDGELAWAILEPQHLAGAGKVEAPSLRAAALAHLPRQSAPGTMIRHPWDLVERNGPEILRDVGEADHLPPPGPRNLLVVGPPDQVFVDPSARLDPLVVVDTTQGPVVIERDAVVTAFTRIDGPCLIGAGTQVLGAKLRGGVTLGPQCRIGGEVETSVVHGYTNKYHEGFLGHSYLGEWVNLGAGTHTSDLRNDYGEVEIVCAGRRLRTGRNKVGCYVGDHSKSGLGTLINTGTNVGVFCNLLPAGRLAPKYLPSFTSWWNGALRPGFPLAQLLATANQVMPRRGQTLTSAHVRLYESLWEETESERFRALRECEQKAVRHSA